MRIRVIAGSAGGQLLDIPKSVLRPTMDKVRGAIFSSLGDSVPGSRVLDLFAGTGALGIEALSRGAANADFVESDRAAVRTIEANLAKCRLAGGRIVRGDVFRFLDTGPPAGTAYDIIFADPPYVKDARQQNVAAELLAHPGLPGWLTEGGLFVLELANRQALPDVPGWTCIRRKAYGGTGVLFFNRT